ADRGDDGAVGAADRGAEAASFQRALLRVDAEALRPDALELLSELVLVDDRAPGEPVQAVAAHERLAPILGLERGDGLAERAGVRRQDPSHRVDHADEMR